MRQFEEDSPGSRLLVTARRISPPIRQRERASESGKNVLGVLLGILLVSSGCTGSRALLADPFAGLHESIEVHVADAERSEAMHRAACEQEMAIAELMDLEIKQAATAEEWKHLVKAEHAIRDLTSRQRIVPSNRD